MHAFQKFQNMRLRTRACTCIYVYTYPYVAVSTRTRTLACASADDRLRLSLGAKCWYMCTGVTQRMQQPETPCVFQFFHAVVSSFHSSATTAADACHAQGAHVHVHDDKNTQTLNTLGIVPA